MRVEFGERRLRLIQTYITFLRKIKFVGCGKDHVRDGQAISPDFASTSIIASHPSKRLRNTRSKKIGRTLTRTLATDRPPISRAGDVQ